MGKHVETKLLHCNGIVLGEHVCEHFN